MKKKEFERMFKQWLPELPGFAVKGHLLYKEPIGHILRGFCGEGSGFSKTDFTIHVFAQPLYEPEDFLWFSYGKRIGLLRPSMIPNYHAPDANAAIQPVAEAGSTPDSKKWYQWYDKEDPTAAPAVFEWIKSLGLAFLEGCNTPEEFLCWMPRFKQLQNERLDFHDRRILGYTQAFVGRWKEAIETLGEVLANPNEDRPWVFRYLEQTEQLYKILLHTPEKAKQLLLEWEQFTRNAIGLNDIP